MNIILIMLIVLCFLFALTSFAVCRKLTPVVNDKRNVFYIDVDENLADDLYNCYRRFEIQKKSKHIEQGDIIKYIPLNEEMVMVKHAIEKRQFQVVDVYDGTKIGCPEYDILSIAPCYYPYKD